MNPQLMALLQQLAAQRQQGMNGMGGMMSGGAGLGGQMPGMGGGGLAGGMARGLQGGMPQMQGLQPGGQPSQANMLMLQQLMPFLRGGGGGGGFAGGLAGGLQGGGGGGMNPMMLRQMLMQQGQGTMGALGSFGGADSSNAAAGQNLSGPGVGPTGFFGAGFSPLQMAAFGSPQFGGALAMPNAGNMRRGQLPFGGGGAVGQFGPGTDASSMG